LSYQIFVVATPLPTIGALLDDAIPRSASKADAVRSRAAVAHTCKAEFLGAK
jgi:hypothetical protein